MDSKKIGERLVHLRGDKSQSIVAKACNISPSALSMYEQGERIPRDKYKIALAAYYHTTVQRLFFDD